MQIQDKVFYYVVIISVTPNALTQFVFLHVTCIAQFLVRASLVFITLLDAILNL